MPPWKSRYEDVPSNAQWYFQEVERHQYLHLLRNTTMYYDPILTPIFVSVWGSAGISFGAFSISYAAIASAIAAGGEYWEPRP